MSRELAATLTHATCPRCGAGRVAAQTHCLECGLRLPIVVGGIARLRRGWVRSIGWYPGDWVWVALVGLVLAAAGAITSILVNRHEGPARAATVVLHAPGSSAPRVTGRNGRTRWPAGLDGWTVVLLSSPATKGPTGPRAAATTAARHGLLQVGVLDSSSFASLHPGYYVVFSGVYGAPRDANVALATVRDRGYGAAYVARVAP
jgi:hypothetical protein